MVVSAHPARKEVVTINDNSKSPKSKRLRGYWMTIPAIFQRVLATICQCVSDTREPSYGGQAFLKSVVLPIYISHPSRHLW